ncbi:glycosyltransferase family 2 protein [Luteimonas sp. MC1825]|uniref:glycosyltransferase family 2 protein n=1 Tax=Luteimonas sp. MC1825 TaxID=2761107 RepID=UPI001616B071|nr:glycosyltransferase family 2 protein [Luteimonas sp. MC1825]MBB6600403.1 glycosyltransferase family 2 protein [Luteimonas sp. MC1825]QOC88074.1 glycosyltransferase family 2 protein [Luteimonas sp. MC1825]
MADPSRLGRDNVAIVVPALNEALRIREVVEGALAQAARVILVDDGSDDGTVDRIADLPVTVLRHARRMGKGAALRAGFAEAARQGALAVLTMDGDGQHDAADIPRLIAAANRHPGCVIVGARLRKRAAQPLHRRIGNDFGDWGLGWACGFRVVDSQSGQRLYPRAVFTLPDVPGEGFVFEAQMLVSAARSGARVVAVPIETRYAAADAPLAFRKSHFRLVRDLWAITSHVARQVLEPGDLLARYARTRRQPPVIDDVAGDPLPPLAPEGAGTTGGRH